ncbi:MAG: DUF835 domain-containing protein [Archaeoglobaceae archaeon]
MYSIPNQGRDRVNEIIDRLTKHVDLREGENKQVLRLLRSLIMVNHLISKEDDERKLLREVCHILNKECGYHFTWIGFIAEGSDEIMPVTYSGYGKEPSVPAYPDHSTAACSAAISANNGRSAESDGSLRLEFWKKSKDGKFSSCMELPIIVEGNVFGVLMVYSSLLNAFDETEMEILNQLSNSVGYALSSIRARKKCRKMETTVQRLENEYHSLLENTAEGVVLVKDGVINLANPQAEKILDLNDKELAFKPFEELVHPLDRKKVSEHFLRGRKRNKPQTCSFRTTNKYRDPRWIEVRSVPLQETKEHTTMNFLRDVTEKKLEERQAKMRHLKFKVEEGNLYLVKEKSTLNSLEVFDHLVKFDYHGLIISRTPREKFKINTNGCEFWWITEREIANSLSPDLEEIQLRIEELFGMVILIYCLDYLKFHNGFNKTAKFIQSLREIAYLNEHIVILPLDPTTLSDGELRLIETETMDLECKDGTELSEDYLEILKFIHAENKAGKKPSYTEVEKAAGITKPTVRKRVRKLVNSGYLIQSTTGRTKSLEVAEKIRNLLL